MAEALTIRVGNVEVGTGTIRAGVDAIHVSCTDVPSNNDDGTQHRYRFRVTPPAGAESATWSGYSELKTSNADGEMYWEGYIFPATGSWTLSVWDEELDEEVVATGVTVV